MPREVNVTPRYCTEVVMRRVSPARVNVFVEDNSLLIRIWLFPALHVMWN